MTGLRDRKKQALRQAIYDAALTLFEQEGFDAVTVTRITRAVGIAKGTFFNHFPSKADILADWYRQTFADSLAAPLPADLDRAGRLVELVHRVGARAALAPELWRAKNAEALRTPAIQEAERAVDTALAERLGAEIRAAIEGGHWRSDLDADALADLVLTLATGTWREVMVTGRTEMARSLLESRLASLDALCTLAKATTAP